MTDHASLLRQIFTEARPLVVQALELAEKFKGFRDLAGDNGLDWSQVKALLKAQVQDEIADDGKNRVKRIIDKADFATAYADMLGIGAKMNEKSFSSEFKMAIQPTNDGGRHDPRRLNPSDSRERPAPISLPPHDSDGVIIEEPEAGAQNPAEGETAPVLGDAGETDREATGNMLAASPIVPQRVALTSDAAPVEPSSSPDMAPGAFPDLPNFLKRGDPQCAVGARQ